MDREIDYIATLVAIFIGIGIAIFIAISVALAYFVLLYLVRKYRSQDYRRQARGIAEGVFAENGFNQQAESVVYSVYGVRPQGSGMRSRAEMIFGTTVSR